MTTTQQLDLQQMRTAAAQACALLKTLGNPDRLMLLCQLARGEYSVGQLEAQLGIAQPTLSQQLGVLREEKLVGTRRDGKQIFYRIDSDAALAVIQVLYRQFCLPTEGVAS